MYNLVMTIIVLSLLVFIIGFIVFLIPKKRKKGLKIMGLSVLVFLVANIYGAVSGVMETEEWKQNDKATNTVQTTVQIQEKQPETKPQPEQKRNPRLNPAKNMALILDHLKQLNMEYTTIADKVCISDNNCSIYIDNTQINAAGGTVNIFNSTRLSADDYMAVCSIILTGLSQLPSEQVAIYTVQGFAQAMQNGEATLKNIAGTDFKVRIGTDGRYQCSYFRFTD